MGTNVPRAILVFGLLLLPVLPMSATYVGITNRLLAVQYDVSSYTVSGTNDSAVVGWMWVSNATLGGASVSFAAAPAWAAPAVELWFGANAIVVYGTNTGGTVSHDRLWVFRYNKDASGEQSGSRYGRRVPGVLVGWGKNISGQTRCPLGTNYVAIAAGEDHSLALRLDGTLVAWGPRGSTATNCPAGSNYVAIAAGFQYSLALRSDGTLAGWGRNVEGQTNCPAGNDYVAIAAGGGHSLALRAPGTLVGWGSNVVGQRNCPAGNNYVAIAAGESHSLALRSDGTVVGWGANWYGQSTCPAGSNHLAIAAARDSSLALRADGTLVGWGYNPGGLSNWTNCPPGSNYVAIAAGYYHALALLSDGTLVGWASNSNGETNCPAGVYFMAAGGGYHSLGLMLPSSVMPFVDITTEQPTDIVHTAFFDVQGTNNDLVVGATWWTNSLGGSGTMSATLSWNLTNVPLNLGANVIIVRGTNTLGWQAQDSITVITPEPGAVFVVLVAALVALKRCI